MEEQAQLWVLSGWGECREGGAFSAIRKSLHITQAFEILQVFRLRLIDVELRTILLHKLTVAK